YVTGTLFESLGIQPARGRWILPSDDQEGAPLAIVISDGLWKRAFGGSGDAIGREVKQNGLTATIVGVMPPGFEYPPGQVDVSEVWSPLQLTAAQIQARGQHTLSILAKLRSGTSIEQAGQALAAQVNAWGQRQTNNFHTEHPTIHPLLQYGMQDEVV